MSGAGSPSLGQQSTDSCFRRKLVPAGAPPCLTFQPAKVPLYPSWHTTLPMGLSKVMGGAVAPLAIHALPPPPGAGAAPS